MRRSRSIYGWLRRRPEEGVKQDAHVLMPGRVASKSKEADDVRNKA